MQRFVSLTSIVLLLSWIGSVQGFDVIRGNVKKTLLRGKPSHHPRTLQLISQNTMAVSDVESYTSSISNVRKVQVEVFPGCIAGETLCRDCQALVREANPELLVEITYDAVVTMNFIKDRVRVFCEDETDTVLAPPHVG